jgi:ATP/maltotriose-dependent transcriptional regulator MalT
MLCGLGYLARSRGALRDAQLCYAEVVQLVRAGAAILGGELVYGMARLYERAGDDTAALGLLLALDGAAVDHHIAGHAARRRSSLEARTTADQRAAAVISRRPLLALLDELCARPVTPPVSRQASQELPAEPIVPAGGLYIAETGEVLSAREVEVLRLLVGGASNQAIAERLVISRFTAKNHVASILQKLAVASRTQAALRARTLGLEPHTLR